MRRTHWFTSCVLVLSACAAPAAYSNAPSPQAASKVSSSPSPQQMPQIVPAVGDVTVAIVIDQLAAWVAAERLPLLPETGGFARLRREGTWYKDVRFSHAITETAPGHASLYTGTTPNLHGIVANEILRPKPNQGLGYTASGILVDPSVHILAPDGEHDVPGSSAAALQVDVVADHFKSSNPSGKVYSFSLKDRGAIFGGGHHPDLVLWYDPAAKTFVSSTAFIKELPAWILPAIGRDVIDERIARPWTLLDAAWVSAHARSGDDQAGEGNYADYGTVFPHLAQNSKEPYKVYRSNPDSDRLLLELGILALDHTSSEAPVLLALSLSANDYIGHLFGPDSWESWDELRRLDDALGWFFTELDKRKGATHWSVVLSADHGIAPLPEMSRASGAPQHCEPNRGTARPCETTVRMASKTLEVVARNAAKRAIGKGKWIAAVVDPYLYFTSDVKTLSTERRQSLNQAVVSALSTTPGVSKVFDSTVSPKTCPGASDESLESLVCRSIRPETGGDYYIALKPGVFFDTGYVPGFGTCHGNVGLYDRSVPVLVRAVGQVSAARTVTEPGSFELFSQLLKRSLEMRHEQ